MGIAKKIAKKWVDLFKSNKKDAEIEEKKSS